MVSLILLPCLSALMQCWLDHAFLSYYMRRHLGKLFEEVVYPLKQLKSYLGRSNLGFSVFLRVQVKKVKSKIQSCFCLGLHLDTLLNGHNSIMLHLKKNPINQTKTFYKTCPDILKKYVSHFAVRDPGMEKNTLNEENSECYQYF